MEWGQLYFEAKDEEDFSVISILATNIWDCAYEEITKGNTCRDKYELVSIPIPKNVLGEPEFETHALWKDVLLEISYRENFRLGEKGRGMLFQLHSMNKGNLKKLESALIEQSRGRLELIKSGAVKN